MQFIKASLIIQCIVVAVNGLSGSLRSTEPITHVQVTPRYDVESYASHLGFTAFIETGRNQLSSEASAEKMESIVGRIELNGKMSDVDCDCTDKWKSSVDKTVSQCLPPNKFRIQRIDRLGPMTDLEENMTPEQVRDFLGLPSALKYVEVGDTILHDVDGRTADKILGSPGGDAGEFILAAQIYSDLLDIIPSDKEVRGWFLSYLEHIAPRKFYMHSSADAVESVQSELSVEGLDISAPKADPPTLRAQLLGECAANRAPPCGLMAPSNVGDAHLKLMMSHPGVYVVDTKLVQSFIKVFYSELWEGEKEVKKQLQFEVLSAAKLRNERALVNILVSDTCRTEKKFPLIQVRTPEQAIFVNHPGAADARRQELAAFFAGMSTGLVKYETILSRMASRGAQNLDVTAMKVAKDLPVYNVIVE